MSRHHGFFRSILGASAALVLTAGLAPSPTAAANLVEVGDRVIIASYISMTPEEIAAHRVTVVQLDDQNKITTQREVGVGEL